jgi:SAM-dependent methyltransferase
MGARVFAGDLHDARYPGGTFDLVACIEVLEHIPAPAVYLQEMARILRPGGLLLLTTPNFQGLSRWLFGSRWRVIDPEHLGYFTPRTLRSVLEEAGFRSVSVRSRSLDVSTWRWPSEESTRAFDPHSSARLREEVETSVALRAAKAVINAGLGLVGAGDSLLAWATR